MPRELWTGLLHVIPLKHNDVLNGARGAYVTVFAFADGEDDSVTVSVPEASVEEAKDAIEAMTEPDELVGEP